ncbi:hypothetical protein Q1695_006946 [Nippostrongylus brasiliensis]|nr:hypothetical protein Q1695_006946 [Nippostrongylus brasiliensis]
MAEEPEEEYQVENIITHLEYEEAFELRGYIVFNPLTGNGTTHSKYVYFVKWLGYPESENTWEPEENLVDCTEVLSVYKTQHGLPLYHETFNRVFNWKEPTTCLTFAEVNRRAFKNRDQMLSATQLVRDPPTKRKKKEDDLEGFVVESDSCDPDYPLYSHSSSRKRSSTSADKKGSEVKRKRGPKKSPSERKKPGRKPRSSSTKSASSLSATSNVPASASSSAASVAAAVVVNEDKPKKKKKEEEPKVEVVRYVLDNTVRRSRSPVRKLLDTRRYSSAERLPERWFKEVEEMATEECAKATRERLGKLVSARFAMRKDLPLKREKMIICMREKSTSSEGEQRLYRVVGSSRLKKFLKENNISCKLPVIVPAPPEKTEAFSPPNITSTELKLNNAEVGDRKVSYFVGDVAHLIAALRKYAQPESLEDADAFVKVARQDNLPLNDNELLVVALSYAELSYKPALQLLRSVVDDNQRFELVKLLVNNVRIADDSTSVIRNPSKETSSSLARRLVECELSSGSWFETTSHCSAAHWKCRLIFELISVCSTSRALTDPSYPFNGEAFLHCLRFGAHCQKLAFVKSGAPFREEMMYCDFLGVRINHVHIVAMQGNPRYLFQFIKDAFDVNALTARGSPTCLDADMTVKDVLNAVVKTTDEDMSKGSSNTTLSKEQRCVLSDVAEIIAEWDSVLQSFVRDSVGKKLVNDARCEVVFERPVSPVHTFRISRLCPTELSIRTVLFSKVPIPLLTRWLGMIAKGKSAMVLCIYSVSITYVPPRENSSEACELPLRISRKVLPDCSVQDASLHDETQKYSCNLIPDTSSSSESEWYFVLDVESLAHISTNTTSLRLRIAAPADTTFLAQFVLVTRRESCEVEIF